MRRGISGPPIHASGTRAPGWGCRLLGSAVITHFPRVAAPTYSPCKLVEPYPNVMCALSVKVTAFKTDSETTEKPGA
jgi:hypothetical protein